MTTYFYLAIGSTELDIGRFGFVMSIGALIGSPISGAALDKFGPWVPLSVTAGACAAGCLWRGMAEVSRGIDYLLVCCRYAFFVMQHSDHDLIFFRLYATYSHCHRYGWVQYC